MKGGMRVKLAQVADALAAAGEGGEGGAISFVGEGGIRMGK